MGKWVEQFLGNLIIEEKKSTIQVQGASNFGDYPFFTSGDSVLIHDKYLVDGEKLFLATGGKANIKFYNGKAAYSTDTYVISSEKASTQYLYYYLLNQIDFINSNLFTGSGLKHLQKNDFKKFKFKLPEEKPEQTRIAQILSKADAAIAQTEALISKYQRIKTGLMQDLLTKGIDEHGNIRSEQTHRFKTEKGLRVPEEWDVDCIDNLETAVLDFKANGSFETLTANVKYYYDQNYARLIRLTDLRNGLKFDGVFIDEKGFQFLKKTRLVEGDILISCVGEYTGFVCQMPKVPYQATIAPNMFVVRFKDTVVNSYAYRYMTSSQFQNQILVVSTSSATKLLNNPNLRSLKLAIPPKEEQIAIATKFDKVERLINEYKVSLEKLQFIKTGLMQDLLSGKVRVKIKEETLVNT